MRTTLTLDDDVAQQLERLRRERPESFKALVNQALREGIARMEAPPPHQPFRTRTASLGRPRVSNLDDVAEVLETLDAEDRRL
jgi:hypothetical protein